jgi:hypothetical protein
MNVNKCPGCKSKNTHLNKAHLHITGCNTEVWIPAYCADCGCSYYIIYQPDRYKERS